MKIIDEVEGFNDQFQINDRYEIFCWFSVGYEIKKYHIDGFSVAN